MTGSLPTALATPVPLGTSASFGFGDRIGLATPGHLQALLVSGAAVAPVFAQQSARELARTGRTYVDVLDAARSAVEAAGWSGRYGADADHCKTFDQIEAAAAAGYTMFTLDPSDLVDASADKSDGAELERRFVDLPWDALTDASADLRRRYRRGIELAGSRVGVDDAAVARAAVKYLRAVAHAADLARSLPAGVDIEVSVDETPTPTTTFEHAFVSAELARRRVTATSLAPRFPGRFEKGIDYRGSLPEFRAAAHAHAEVALAFGGYKLSLHSGSDKPSLYPILAEATGGRFHVKTAGTSYLEALRVLATEDPLAFRAVWEVARANYAVDRRSYDLTAEPADVPAVPRDDELQGLLDDDSARRILHVTYGSVLTDRDLAGRLRAVLVANGGRAYVSVLAAHFGAHLEALGR